MNIKVKYKIKGVRYFATIHKTDILINYIDLALAKTLNYIAQNIDSIISWNIDIRQRKNLSLRLNLLCH